MAGINDIWNKVKDLPGDVSDVADRVRDVFDKVRDLPDNVEDAIRDIGEVLDRLREIIDDALPEILNKVRDFPQKAQEILTAITRDVLGGLRDLFNKLADLLEFLGADGGPGARFKAVLQQFFENCGNILKNPVGLLLGDGAFIRDALATLARLFAEAAVAISTAFITALAAVGDGLANELYRLGDQIATLFKKVLGKLLDAFCSAITRVSQFPQALQNGPLQSCVAVKQIFDWIRESGVDNDFEDRVAAVENSLVQLFAQIGGAPNVIVIEQGVRNISRLLRRLFNSSGRRSDDPGTVFEEFLQDLVFPKEVLVNVLDAAVRGQLWKWAEFPSGLVPGDLAKWINDESTYLNGSVTTLERQYRMRMLGAADAYLRAMSTELNIAPGLTHSDRRMSPELLSDLVATFVDTTVLFILEPKTFPSLSDEMESFEDFGRNFSSSIGRQLRSSISVKNRMLFRGFWMFSVQNEALVELIASAIGALFSSLAEGVVRHLTWTLEIRSRYAGDNSGNIRAVTTVLSLDRSASSPVEYVAFMRNAPSTSAPRLGPALEKIVQDYAAYLDMCYNMFGTQDRFGQTFADGFMTATLNRDTRELTVIMRQVNGAPVPVVRVYVLGRVYVMNHVNRRHRLETVLPYLPRRDFGVECLTSEGGHRKLYFAM